MVIQPGTRYNVRLSLDIEVYQNEDISEEIESIVYTYENKFGVEFNDETLSEISTLISKISNVKRIVNVNISYYDENNLTVDIAKIDPAISYYKLSPVVTLISE
jgi:ethanolamine utilization cobalamin adenosyltransferase